MSNSSTVTGVGAARAAPVSEATLKAHIQLTHTLDDAIVLGVGGYMLAATADVEKMGGVSLIRQSRRQYVLEDVLYDPSGKSVSLTHGPIISVTSVGYIDADGNEQTLDPSMYRASPNTGYVYFKDSMPTLAEGPATLWVNYEAGFGDTPDDVPADWQNIVMTVAMRKYEYRGADSGSSNDSYRRMLKSMVDNAIGGYRA